MGKGCCEREVGFVKVMGDGGRLFSVRGGGSLERGGGGSNNTPTRGTFETERVILSIVI